MSGCDQWALLKGFEVLLCISCLIFKWWTDYESSRLYFLLEKQSREWPLLNNVTWNQSGSWFADVTFGGFTIICVALFIAHLVGELKTTRKTESFLLGIGALLFIGVGMMVLSSFDSVPEDLFDNAIILGFLSLITGFVFLLDIGCVGRRSNHHNVHKPKPKKEAPRLKRDVIIVNENAEKNQKVQEPSKSKPEEQKKMESKVNNVQSESVTDGSKVKERVINELKTSVKKKSSNRNKTPIKEAAASTQTTTLQIEDEALQTKENMQYGRKYMKNKGFVLGKRPSKDGSIENYNNYDYDMETMKKEKEKEQSETSEDETDTDGEDEEEESEDDYKIQPKPALTTVETQTTTTFVQIKNGKKTKSKSVSSYTKETNTGTDTVDYGNVALQSPSISSSVPYKSNTKAGYTVEVPSMSLLLSEKGRKLLPSLSSSRIERLSPPPKNYQWSRNPSSKSYEEQLSPLGSVPSSPKDPGYVLHTAARWPHPAPPLPESSYEKWKVKNNLQSGPIHSDV